MPESSYPLESLLSARTLLAPVLVGEHVYFLGNMSGHLSLYRMKKEGGMPEPLLPPDIALQNPHLMMGESFVVFPGLKKILVMIDHDGDENYQACTVPLEGGIPENLFGEKYAKQQLLCFTKDLETSTAFFWRDDRKTPDIECLRVRLKTMQVTSLGTSKYGNVAVGTNRKNSEVVLIDGYTAGDNVLYLWKEETGRRELLYGTPIEKRKAGKLYPPSGMDRCNFTDDGRGLLVKTTEFDDAGSVGYLHLDGPARLVPVQVSGARHKGKGELEDVAKVDGDRYLVRYNIDGCSFAYEGRLITGRGKKAPRRLVLETCVVGQGPVSGGVLLGIEPWKSAKGGSGRAEHGYSFAFATATSPSQIYVSTVGGKVRYSQLSNERVLGIPKERLSAGEDASFTSFDGLRISARLYLPATGLGFQPPYPLVLYVHGGPQGQERPDFTWFSMPLIQNLALNGFAVFVPNARGSTGYGSSFMRRVDHDWGGKDRLDHVEGLKALEKDSRVDSSRRAVIGRSYGGYMTLTLASRHPGLWKAAVDMFGPYDLTTFYERLPETWRTGVTLTLGDPKKDAGFFRERSPSTYIDDVKCAMMMIQGRNDPRVVERETHDVVDRLRSRGVPVEYIVFEDEGHDVLKLQNRVRCYRSITQFFRKNLSAGES